MKIIFAHRGMSSLAPENTLSAFALCAKYGVKWVECDLDILADETVVLSHDDSLDRCTDRSGSLYDLTVDDLSDIDAGSWFSDDFIGEKIPTFAEFITLVNHQKLNVNVEIKSCRQGWAKTERMVQSVATALRQVDSDCQILVSSFNHQLLREFKLLSPEIPVACLFDKHSIQEDWLTPIQACLASAIHVEDEGLTQAQVIDFKRQGVEVNVYTVNDLARANQLFNWGVDGVFTDIAQNFPARYRSQISAN